MFEKTKSADKIIILILIIDSINIYFNDPMELMKFSHVLIYTTMYLRHNIA